MIRYLLPAKKKGGDFNAQEREPKRRRLSDAAHKIWKVYLGQPRKVVRILVFFACSMAVLFQLAQCFRKLNNPPISTHSRVLINTTLAYPSITICRSPSYRKDILEKYGLGSSIMWTSEWKNFPFGNTTLTDFWNEATFTSKELIGLCGLNRRPEHVEIRSNLFFLAGQCHTIVPLVTTTAAGMGVGYSMMLKHTDARAEDRGWQVFIHEASEPWSESWMQTSGRFENFWMDVGEELHLKITAHHVKTINQKKSPCETDVSYSSTECLNLCRWTKLASVFGCSAPWMDNGTTSTLPVKECNTYQQTRDLFNGYLRQAGLSSIIAPSSQTDNNTNEAEDSYGCQAKCLRPCSVTQYTTFVINRKSVSSPKDKRVKVKDKSIYMQRGDGDPDTRNNVGLHGSSAVKDTMARRCNDDKPCGKVFDNTNEGLEYQRGLMDNNESTLSGSNNRRLQFSTDYSKDNLTLESNPELFGQVFLDKVDKHQFEFERAGKAAESAIAINTLKVFYSSKMVTVMEENWGYDFSQFVADAGGSLGFLLGMSVVGAVTFLEQIAESLVASTSSKTEGKSLEKTSIGVGKAEEGSMVPYNEMKNKY